MEESRRRREGSVRIEMEGMKFYWNASKSKMVQSMMRIDGAHISGRCVCDDGRPCIWLLTCVA